MNINIPNRLATDLVCKSGGDSLQSCFQCGLCTGVCPFFCNGVDTFSMRKIVGSAKLGVDGYENPDILNTCSTCGLCQHNCPRGVKQIDLVKSIRAITAKTGFLPDLYRNVVYSVRTFLNPWGSELSNTFLFERDMGVPLYTDDTEYCLFPCCSAGYEPRVQEPIKALASLLQKAGVSFGAIKGDLICCGESVRKIGAEEEFESLAGKNMEIWKQNGVRKIITLSPHCYHTIKNEYEGEGFEVYHYSEILFQNLDKLKLRPHGPLRVTYHDPCYLGRHSELYDPPRGVIDRLENVTLTELDRSRQDSLCCGGGGGKIWLNVTKEERIADLRIADAGKKEMDTVITACPYCIMMLEYSRDMAESENENRLDVMDLAELVNMCAE